MKLRWKIPVIARISFGLTGLVVSVLMLISLLGLFPDSEAEALRNRKLFCESAAVSVTLMAQKADAKTIRAFLESLAERNPDIQSLGVRRDDGLLVVEIGNHSERWKPADAGRNSPAQIWIPFYSDGEQWGQFESVFQPIRGSSYLALLLRPGTIHGLLATVMCCLAFYAYLRIVLRHLDPSQVIPNRVRAALDNLAEGLLILDQNDRIVLANRAFEESTGTNMKQLLGVSIDSICFVSRDDAPAEFAPWKEAIQTGHPVTGRLLGIKKSDTEDVVFSVSASPIVDDKGTSRGILASFEDVTRLEEKKRELSGMVDYLRASSTAIKQQNQELERLATRDPLTACLNRRAFFEQFDAHWHTTQRYQNALSAMMVDIDFFKSINDEYGHGMGDEVLRKVADKLCEVARETDVVCRYGGEEFAVLLPHTNIKEAAVAAERARSAIEELRFPDFTITVSIGVSAHSPESATPQELLDQADKCLYVSKRRGRNQVVRWDQVPDDLEIDESKVSRIKEPTAGVSQSVPYHAVTALISALAYRDQRTAEHSRRVADLCVVAAEGLLSLQDCYTLEIAALLHDIGKIGVPDGILLKPGALTPEEWNIMRRNDTIGIEIIRASFGSPQLTAIVEHCRTHYGNPDTTKPSGNRLPVGSRILAIADAYDAMTTDREFRQALSKKEAFAELRNCAGRQFDPELVERFIATAQESSMIERCVFEAVSKDAALAIGQQIERLSQVLDLQDFDALDAMSNRLQATAAQYGAQSIAEKAAELGTTLEADRDSYAIIRTANELLDLCRMTQQSFLEPEFQASSGAQAAVECEAHPPGVVGGSSIEP